MIKIGAIGLGARGLSLLSDILLNIKNVTITAVCDIYEDRTDVAIKKVLDKTGKSPKGTTNYIEVINNPEVDAVVIMSAWESHVDIAIASMIAGKPVAMEVGGAYSIKDCWKLVDTYEQTKTPFMFLENCCFGKYEMMTLNMKNLGVLGDIVHCSGMYGHDLRDEIAFGEENRHYRLRNYLNRNCENYPTHELGPIAKIMDINHGNRMVSLVTVASKSAGLHEFIKKNDKCNKALLDKHFAQGDIVKTLITCSNGSTIELTLDTTLPRFYSRGLTVRGTKGMYIEDNNSVFLDDGKDKELDFEWKKNWNNAEKYEEKYRHPVWCDYINEGVQGTHDGMDWLEFSKFITCLEENTPMPIDVYDAAAWMCITPLSEKSIATDARVEIPDFTRGKWLL